jgi:hypothetical protein
MACRCACDQNANGFAYELQTADRVPYSKGMARRTKAQTDWIDTAEGIAAYRACRAEAQAACNADGFDRGIEANRLFKTWRHFMLPQARNRYGHEVQCEVVRCEDLSKTQPGHGYQATIERPPSPTAPVWDRR